MPNSILQILVLGLLKKDHEIRVLSDAEISVIIFFNISKFYNFWTPKTILPTILEKYQTNSGIYCVMRSTTFLSDLLRTSVSSFSPNNRIKIFRICKPWKCLQRWTW